MLKNYYKIAFRNMLRHRTDSLINVIGLSVAFTSALLLLLSVSYEFSYDKFHANAKNIYHLYFQTQRPKDKELSNAMPAPLMPALKSYYPDIKYAVRNMDGGTTIRYKDKKISPSLKYTDAGFFSMFSFPIIKGNATAPLKNLNDVVLRKGTAKAVFHLKTCEPCRSCSRNQDTHQFASLVASCGRQFQRVPMIAWFLPLSWKRRARRKQTSRDCFA